MTPLHRLVYASPVASRVETTRGVSLPNGYADRVGAEGLARAIAIGPEVLEVKPGDVFVFRRYLKDVHVVDGGFLINEKDIEAVVEGSGEFGEEYALP